MLARQYTHCIESMFKLRRFGIKLGLSTIKHILNKLGNPQNNFHSIHIAGTNGKGSVASALSTILQKAGYSVGLYTSPHLVSFNERICVNNIPISDKRVVDLWEIIKLLQPNTRETTFFEFATAMAICEFEQKNVDFAVIETGMGGRLDATNIISPVLGIITNISLEHKDYLGNTIKQITKEKAGIIKSKIPTISGVTQKSAITVVKETAKKMKSELLLKGRDFKTRKKRSGTFSYWGKYNRWSGIRTSLLGNHQIDNAAITLAACEILNKQYAHLPLKHIRSGLSSNKWQGRLEVVLKSPYVILDGAHNLMAAKNLSSFLKNNLIEKKITLIVGILDDKPYKNMLKELIPPCSQIIITQPCIERALTLEKMKEAAKIFSSKIKTIPNVGEALIYAISNSDPNDAVCVAGSLYVVGEAKKKLRDLKIT